MARLLFPFHTLRSIIAGTSAIDVPYLNLRNRDEAADFMSAYGYEYDDPHDAAEVVRLRDEAVQFLDEVLDLGERIPHEVRANEDVLALLLIASMP